MRTIHDIINYSAFIRPSEFGKCKTEGKKLHQFEKLQNKKIFLDEKISVFDRF